MRIPRYEPCGHHFAAFQVIPQPASVWDVCVLPNGDVVTACADNAARVFTRDPSRAASEALQMLYQVLCRPRS